MSYRYSRYLKRIKPIFHQSFLEKEKDHSIFRFWQRGGGFDRNLFNDQAIHEGIRYIENNPVRSKLAIQSDHYCWSSAWSADENEKFRPKINRSSVPVKMINRHWPHSSGEANYRSHMVFFQQYLTDPAS